MRKLSYYEEQFRKSRGADAEQAHDPTDPPPADSPPAGDDLSRQAVEVVEGIASEVRDDPDVEISVEGGDARAPDSAETKAERKARRARERAERQGRGETP